MLYLFFTSDYDTGYFTHLQGVFSSKEQVREFIKEQAENGEAFYNAEDYRIVEMVVDTPKYVNLGY